MRRFTAALAASAFANGRGHDLTTCTYTGAVSGNQYTATGFFTP